ncbi:MAG: hypothetical protein HY517_00675 [Candidatus Aenigmarchaeota archaeon]|nr:hypothetical protein [Candidatus Aenigmarchaeota archaeon]
MPLETPKDLQNFAKAKFEQYFDAEISIGKSAGFRIDRDIYSPEPDVAVGPFATGTRKFIQKYNHMASESRDFIEMCIEAYETNRRNHSRNLSSWGTRFHIPEFETFCNEASNENSRCFIAVEIENDSTSLKHLLGSTINAVALGRVGILVGFSDDKVRAFLRCLDYLKFLKDVGKPSINFSNGLVLTKDQFIDILSKLERG